MDRLAFAGPLILLLIPVQQWVVVGVVLSLALSSYAVWRVTKNDRELGTFLDKQAESIAGITLDGDPPTRGSDA